MKNLLELLKPEILNVIEESAEKYPFIVKELKQELQNLYYASDIRYGTVIHLDGYYLAAFNKLPINAWENFIK